MRNEICWCCNGTGICLDIDGVEGACLTCDGAGHFNTNK